MSTPKEVQLLKYKDDSFELDVVALQSIVLREDVKNLPVVLYSIAGAFRGGKSFLLNYFLRYLNSPVFKGQKDGKPLGEVTEALTGFSWRGGSKRNTVGILMWSEPIIKTLDNGEKVAILLIDTQGLFDDTTSTRDCSIIFALSTLLSSMQIYNIRGNLQEDHLQFLQLFTQYAKLGENEESKSFQNLLFLIRDWVYYDTHPCGSKGGDDLVAARFELSKDLSPDMTVLRQGILDSFEKVSGFLMPHPGFKVMNPKFDGRLADLEENFKTSLLELVMLLFSPSNLIPKKMNGQTICAKDLPAHFTVFMDLFKSNETPTVTSMTKAISDISLQTAENEAVELYENNMNAKFGVDALSVPQTVIQSSHVEALEAAKEFFNGKKKIGSEEDVKPHLDKIVEELARRQMQYLVMNETKLGKLINETVKVYNDAIKAVRGDSLLCLNPLDLESVHNGAVNRAVQYFKSKRQTDKYHVDDPNEIQISETLKNKLDDLQHENEANTRLYISEIILAYGKVMEAYLSKEYAIEEDDFLKKHNMAKGDAIKTFNEKRNRKTEELADRFLLQLTEKISEKYILLNKINKQHNRKAFKQAFELYDVNMNEIMNRGCCYSTYDLEDHHQRKKQEALLYFHPNKSERDDFEKGLLSSKIDSLFKEHSDTNNWRNRAAIRRALAEYERRMNNAVKPAYSWFLIVPMITSLTNRYDYHQEARTHAFRVFSNERCSSSKYDYDDFRSSLESQLKSSYQRNYQM